MNRTTEIRRPRMWSLPTLIGAGCLVSCAAVTSVSVEPLPEVSLCERFKAQATVDLLWTTQWRADQKDVADRNRAAAAGIAAFGRESTCFKHLEITRAGADEFAGSATAPAPGSRPGAPILWITVRELGPVVRIGASAALVEGGTEVVLDVATTGLPEPRRAAPFTVHWQNGGAGVIKGVASLPFDMASALAAAMGAAKGVR